MKPTANLSLNGLNTRFYKKELPRLVSLFGELAISVVDLYGIVEVLD